MKRFSLFVVTAVFVGIVGLPLPPVKPCVNVRALNPDRKVIVCEPIDKHLVDYPQLPMDGFRMIFERTIGR